MQYSQKYGQKGCFGILFSDVRKNWFYDESFFYKDQLGIGLGWWPLAEIGQKLDFRALFSEIYIKNVVLPSLELN